MEKLVSEGVTTAAEYLKHTKQICYLSSTYKWIAVKQYDDWFQSQVHDEGGSWADVDVEDRDFYLNATTV